MCCVCFLPQDGLSTTACSQKNEKTLTRHLSRLLLLLHLALSVLALLPQGMLGSPGAVDAEEEEEKVGAGSQAVLRRVKRGWVWNQFFVLEEYMGMEPLYIGKVSWWLQALPSVHAHTHTHEHADTLIDMSTDLRTHTPHAHTQTHMST